MTDQLTLTIPAPTGLTRAGSKTALWVTANQRLNWRPKAARVRQWRELALLAARQARTPQLQAAHITAHVHRDRGGRFDPSNWADTAKACIDGLVDAGLLPDDDADHLTGPDMRAGEPRAEACIILTITPGRQP